jgi:hypothetical protein
MHARWIHRPCLFWNFVRKETNKAIVDVRGLHHVAMNRHVIERIAEGANIWDRTIENKAARLHVLWTHAPAATTQHQCKRAVKIESSMTKTGKSELKVSMHALASNGFIAEQGREDADNVLSQNTADDDTNGPKQHV